MRILALLLTLFFSIECFSQGLIINEFSQGEGGTKEYIELLVVSDDKCTPVDLRGWIIDDNNGVFGTGSGRGIASGHLKLTNDPLWSKIPSGTIILIFNYVDISTSIINAGYNKLDTNINDLLLIFPIGCVGSDCPYIKWIKTISNIPNTSNSSYSTPTPTFNDSYGWSSISLSNTSDGVQTRDNSANFYFGIGYGLNTSHPDLAIYDTLRLSFPSTSINTFSLTNQFSKDPRDKRNWTTGTSKTPGIVNSDSNSTYIQSLRPDTITPLFQEIPPQICEQTNLIDTSDNGIMEIGQRVLKNTVIFLLLLLINVLYH